MRKFIYLLAINIFFITRSFCQNTQNDFWGIPFGSNMEKVKQIMESKPGCTLTKYAPNAAWLFEGCRFGGYTSELMIFNFAANQFYSVNVVLLPNSSSDDPATNKQMVQRDFNNVYSSLKEKYGKEVKSPSQYDFISPSYEWLYPSGCKSCDLRITLTALTNQITIDYSNLKIYSKVAKNPKSDF